MIAPDRFKSVRERVFRNRKEHIYAVSMENDRVIPCTGISKALMGTDNRLPSNMEVMNFRFPNYHEMPFPVKKDSIKKQVDEAFEKVFSRASAFLA